jgi:acetyl-CoA carboxylase, biotin carboxylase subunit
MFKRILIANRSEIALRVVRACKELGVETVAVYSEADRDAGYLNLVDETICIGPPQSGKSYLDIPRIISAAEITDVEAIHPGYGFLAENDHFAEVCNSCGIKFIGPRPETIALVGNKAAARQMARDAEVPVIPGSKSLIENDRDALEIAKKIGFPVIIKASAGGGGRGMRVAHNEISLVNAFLAARAEAEIAFADSSVYMEKYIEDPHHIEIQVLGDGKGNLIHLGERDCSLQRRHQKMVEESPSPIVSPELRKEMGDAAVRLCKSAGYENAGTVEFLLDRNMDFFFMEVNARIQVEHPVTEMVTGIDLVKAQLRIAAGEDLWFSQDEALVRGWAIECRVNAEDPDDNLRPCPGKIGAYYQPGGRGVRVDSHVYSGYVVPAHYDSMISKLIVYAETRQKAIATMRRALDEYVIGGVKTTIPLLREIVKHPLFIKGQFDTSFIESQFLDL